MHIFRLLVLIGAAVLVANAGTGRAADPVTTGHDAFIGEFGCSTCHLPDDFEQAPPLAGVVGRKIAGAPNWPYCAPMAAKTGVWDEATLDTFLKDTQAFAPGCLMSFKIDDPAKRGALIAYLKTLK